METKVKTSVTISKKLLKEVDIFAKDFRNRSEFVEKALLEHIAELKRRRRNARDIVIINQNSDELNEEAADVLDYQFDW